MYDWILGKPRYIKRWDTRPHHEQKSAHRVTSVFAINHQQKATGKSCGWEACRGGPVAEEEGVDECEVK